MSARFEIVQDDHGRFCFRLLDSDNHVLLEGLPTTGKIAVQSEVLHARQAIAHREQFVPHTAPHGHFVVLKDKNGEVLARSPRVREPHMLGTLIERIADAMHAPLMARVAQA